MKHQYEILCIFLTSGKTFTFKKVDVREDNETALVFTYLAMSDGFTKQAQFYKQNVAGFSYLKS